MINFFIVCWFDLNKIVVIWLEMIILFIFFNIFFVLFNNKGKEKIWKKFCLVVKLLILSWVLFVFKIFLFFGYFIGMMFFSFGIFVFSVGVNRLELEVCVFIFLGWDIVFCIIWYNWFLCLWNWLIFFLFWIYMYIRKVVVKVVERFSRLIIKVVLLWRNLW